MILATKHTPTLQDIQEERETVIMMQKVKPHLCIIEATKLSHITTMKFS